MLPDPDPEAPPVTLRKELFEKAVQAHPAGAVTFTLFVPPPAEKLWLVPTVPGVAMV
jgi:hypothetical protein